MAMVSSRVVPIMVSPSTAGGGAASRRQLLDCLCRVLCCWTGVYHASVSCPHKCKLLQVVQTQDLQGNRWAVNNFSNTVWEAAIWMHHFFQVPGHVNVPPLCRAVICRRRPNLIVVDGYILDGAFSYGMALSTTAVLAFNFNFI